MKICSLLDRYRDGELDSLQHLQFERHFDECEECRSMIGLLDNIGKIVGAVDVPLYTGFAQRTARVAFSQPKSWEAVLLSLLRPARAWAAAALLFVALSWFMKPLLFAPEDAEQDFEALLAGSDSDFSREMGKIQADEDLLTLLQLEENK